MRIDGVTEKVGLIGYPVSHSFSPLMHNAAFESLKMNYAYVAFDVNPEFVEAAVRGLSALGFKGVNVTVPHKEAVMTFMDSLSEEALSIGAVNTIKITKGRYEGHNTDSYGFSAAIEKAFSMKIAGKNVFVIGAGGGARAVVTKCAVEGAAEIVVADIIPEKARNLVLHVQNNIGGVAVESVAVGDNKMKNSLLKSEIIVNATPLGMRDEDPVPIDTMLLEKGQKVFDLVYNPRETKLMEKALGRGCEVSNGLMMLLYQGMKSFEIWTGITPPEDVMKNELEKKVFGEKK